MKMRQNTAKVGDRGGLLGIYIALILGFIVTIGQFGINAVRTNNNGSTVGASSQTPISNVPQGIDPETLKDNTRTLNLIIGLCVTIVGLQLNELHQSRRRTPKLAVLERCIGMSEDKLFSYLEDIIDRYENVEDILSGKKQCRPFFEERVDDLFTELISGLSSLSNGHMHIGKERELRVNELLFRALPKSEVRAVSYQDESFWNREEGRKFLEAQGQSRKLNISRIFILNTEAAVSNHSIILAQQQAGIQTYVVEDSGLNNVGAEDFVIYDDYAVRFAGPPNQDGSKQAVLTVDPYEVKKYIGKYQEILVTSLEAATFYRPAQEPNRATDSTNRATESDNAPPQ